MGFESTPYTALSMAVFKQNASQSPNSIRLIFTETSPREVFVKFANINHLDMSRYLRQSPWQVPNKSVRVALIEFIPWQCTENIGQKVRDYVRGLCRKVGLMEFGLKPLKLFSAVYAMHRLPKWWHALVAQFVCVTTCIPNVAATEIYRVFTRSSKHWADVEQTSSKRRTNIELAQAGLLEPRPWLKCRPRLRLLAHSWSRVI